MPVVVRTESVAVVGGFASTRVLLEFNSLLLLVCPLVMVLLSRRKAAGCCLPLALLGFLLVCLLDDCCCRRGYCPAGVVVRSPAVACFLLAAGAVIVGLGGRALAFILNGVSAFHAVFSILL